ncbi:hypothetical protein ABPG73_006073 [Tetrahymena malaccensis]
MSQNKTTTNAGSQNIKYMEFDLKYYDQMIEFYPKNLARSQTPQGYYYLIEPIKQQGILVVGLTLAAVFGIHYAILFSFLNIGYIISIFVGSVHLYCFYIAKYLFVQFNISYAKYLIKRYFQKDQMMKYFSGDRKFYIAVDTEKDLLVAMATYDTSFENLLNLPVNETGEVGRVAVRQEYGGRGIAFQIMKLVDEHAKKINRKYIFLSKLNSNKHGYKFYSRQGFILQNIQVQRPFIFAVLGVEIQLMKKTIQ